MIEWTPLVLFGAIAASIIYYFYFQAQKQASVQETLRKAIDSGQALTPESIVAMGVRPPPTPISDVRKGVLLIAFGIAVVIFAHFLLDDEATQVFKGLSAFPIMVGIGYFVVYFFNPDKPKD